MTKVARQIAHSGTFWLGVCVFALIIAAIQQSHDSNESLRQLQVDFCREVTVPGGLAGAERDRDIALFADAAAVARRADGNQAIAKVYEGVSKRSEARGMMAQERAQVPCEERFPEVENPLPFW
jgi:hypothetical protein